jgi:hypothetical protein
MHPIFKVFLFSLVVFIFFFLPALAGQDHCEFDIKGHKGENRDVIDRSGFDKHPDPWDRHPFYKPGGVRFLPVKASSISTRQQEVNRAITDDFLVNDDTAGGCNQDYPAVDRNSSGRFVVVWKDERNDYGDIYAQRFDSSGVPIGLNFRVNDDGGAAWQEAPAVTMQDSGCFVVTWMDNRSGNYDVYAQRYDSAGNPLGSNFKVNDGPEVYWHRHPSIACDQSGNFVIAWHDERNGDFDFDIYAQAYDSTGAPLDSNFRVNDDAGSDRQLYADIAMNDSGSYVITWMDSRDAGYDVYAQRYNSSGTALGSNFKVNDDAGAADQAYPAVAADSTGNFIITWEDARGGDYDIYAQRYDSAGVPIDSNFKVNDDTENANQDYPDIGVGGSDRFVFTWADDRDGDYDIYAQRYDSSGGPLGFNFKVNDDSEPASQQHTCVGFSDWNGFVIIWADKLEGDYDIYAQRYDSSGSSLASNYQVNDDVQTPHQEYPKVAVGECDKSVITWIDYRTGDCDIYAQILESDGTATGPNFIVDDSEDAVPYWPDVDVGGADNFVITWEDYRTVYGDIYAQRFDSSGTALGSNFKVNDDAGTAGQDLASVAMDGRGYFIVTWRDFRNGGGWSGDVYAQRYDSSGTPLGTNFRVNDDTGLTVMAVPAVAMHPAGSFVITWEDYRSWNSDIYAQRYDSSGSPLGSNFKVNDDTGTASQPWATIAMDHSGRFVITWADDRDGDYDIYAQRYDSSGIAWGSNFKVNDDAGTLDQWSPTVAIGDSGNFIIAWEDYRTGICNPDIYAQKYDSSGNPLGGNFLVPKDQYASFAQLNPAVATNGDSIYFAWQDNRRAKGWDIYAKVVGWSWTDVQDQEEVNLPHSFELYQNYPNPFNPVTRIQYAVGGRQTPIHTTLRVYNILGQFVRTLVDEERAPGNYSITWDGKDNTGKEVASGIYFYQLKTKDSTKTRKMILLR